MCEYAETNISTDDQKELKCLSALKLNIDSYCMSIFAKSCMNPKYKCCKFLKLAK